MNTVAVRPRLDLSFDVIQSVAPQYVGTRRAKADAVTLAEWAAKRLAPATLVVYGADGATPESSRVVEGTGRPPRAVATH